MALAEHNATLEYGTNVLEFWLYDDLEVADAFDANMTFNIERTDGKSGSYSAAGAVAGNYLQFNVDIPQGDGTGEGVGNLWLEGDSIYDYDKPHYNHIFSVRSPDKVYIRGKLNLVKAAG